MSRGTPYGVDIRSPGGATETVPGDLSPLRGFHNSGPLLDPTAYAMGYSLAALRAFGSARRVLKKRELSPSVNAYRAWPPGFALSPLRGSFRVSLKE